VLNVVSLNLLRNKRGVALDLKNPRGRQAILDIAATCEVMVTNQRPAPLRRLGLDHESICEVRPDIVFCQAHGYPSDSDMADAPAYDDIIQTAVGIPDLFGRLGDEPRLVPTLVADKVCGMAITNAVLAALFHRARSGEGQHIEISMFDLMRSWMLVEHGSGAIPEPPLGDAGYPRILTPERRPHATADGWINILPYDEQHYVDLFASVGREDLLDRTLIRSRRQRLGNSDTLYRTVATVLPQRTTAEWLAFCREHEIPAAEAASVADLTADLPLAEHPTAGTYRQIPPAEQYSETPQSIRRPAPRLGEHGREVLTECGYDTATIDGLIADGVLGGVDET